MSMTIPTHFVNEYKDNIKLIFGQMESLFADAVEQTEQHSEKQFHDYMGLGTGLNKVTNRHGDTEYSNANEQRRMITMEHFDEFFLIDSEDKLRMFTDPTSTYMELLRTDYNITIDDIIIDAFFGTAYTDKNGSTATAFPSANQVAVNYVESGSATNSGMTLGKFRKARTLLRSNYNPKEGNYIAMSAQQVQNMLTVNEVGSIDYNTVKPLSDGDVDRLLGIEVIETERLKTDSNGYRRLPVWNRRGMLLAKGSEMIAEMVLNPSKRNSVQVSAKTDIGATRTREESVFEIKALEV